MLRFLLPLALVGCAMSHHPTVPFAAPTPKWTSLDDVLAHPVAMDVDVIVSARWTAKRTGLLDPSVPSTDAFPKTLPIELPVVRIRHPRGTIFVDSGVDRDRASGGHGGARGAVKGVLKDVEPVVALGDLIAAEPKVAAVLLTHMHLDHVLGLPDVPTDVDVFIGRTEQSTPDWRNPLLRRTYKALLADRGPLVELQSNQGVDLGGLDGAIDLFGDGAIWALPAPGHTLGSTTYFINAPSPVLVLGDASHTCWGWQNDVAPGRFSHDRATAQESFTRLRAWAAQIPDLEVVAGHTGC